MPQCEVQHLPTFQDVKQWNLQRKPGGENKAGLQYTSTLTEINGNPAIYIWDDALWYHYRRLIRTGPPFEATQIPNHSRDFQPLEFGSPRFAKAADVRSVECNPDLFSSEPKKEIPRNCVCFMFFFALSSLYPKDLRGQSDLQRECPYSFTRDISWILDILAARPKKCVALLLLTVGSF